MQFLEIIFHPIKIALLIAVASSYALAESDCYGEQITNQDIINCSQKVFENVDSMINEQYKILIGRYSVQQRADLILTQRSWVKFKEKYCNDVYDSVYPGREAPIDRLSCLIQITSSRLNELTYLRAGAINDGFYKAVSMVNKKVTNYNYGKAVDIIAGKSEPGELWRDYTMKHCAMTLTIYKEDSTMCTARMRFQIPIN